MNLTDKEKTFLINLLETIDTEDVDFKVAIQILERLQK